MNYLCIKQDYDWLMSYDGSKLAIVQSSEKMAQHL